MNIPTSFSSWYKEKNWFSAIIATCFCNRCVRIVKQIAKERRFAVCENYEARAYAHASIYECIPRPCIHSNTRLLSAVERMLKIANISRFCHYVLR